MSNNEINVAKALKEKSPRIYQFTPSILLKKTELVHEEEINEILQKLKGTEGIEFINKGLEQIDVSSIAYGFEKIPKNKGIDVANHPLRIRRSHTN